MTSRRPMKAAMMSGVAPVSSVSSSDAPASRSCSTIPQLPAPAAMMSGVAPPGAARASLIVGYFCKAAATSSVCPPELR